ncbi:MAG TPA: MOSC domain-containing protein [Solirubrobacteraceae bacterium]|nr:MOSC domain-containing protein [Solirubrobacteraceae bacterium]
MPEPADLATVTAIHLAEVESGPVHAVDRVEAVAGAGLRGDRYFEPGADPERHLTLIESEELERLAAEDGIALAPGESRRQLTTRGVRLNPLVGRRFKVGVVECRGIELCEPCSHLQKLTGRAGLMRAAAHRAGLNAEILTDGEIAVGDVIEALD